MKKGNWPKFRADTLPLTFNGPLDELIKKRPKISFAEMGKIGAVCHDISFQKRGWAKDF